MYTDEIIDKLITCQKKIVDGPKTVPTKGAWVKKSFTLSSEDGLHNFNGFITCNNTFIENFSIGLSYNPKEEKGTIVLTRFNGLHGGTKENPHHAYCHIHTATAERINDGLKPEGKIIKADTYSTFETALQSFVKHIGLNPTDKQKYFPSPSNQEELPFAEL